jgi:hypothetical protein
MRRATLLMSLFVVACSAPRSSEESSTFHASFARIEVTLPRQASGVVTLRDRATGARVSIAIEGATEAEPRPLARATFLYPRGSADGGDVTWRVDARGAEDAIELPRAPSDDVARYRLGLDHVAGLRLVANTLELLDAAGAPRLRMSPPFVVDRLENKVAVTVIVEGCAVDRDPRPPWGRAPTPPGASACRLRLVSARAIETPAVLDPLWSDTASMSVARVAKAIALGTTGRVLVVGGHDGVDALATTEIYDAATGTWAVTDDLPEPRFDAAATWIATSQRVLLAGGCSGKLGACVPSSSAWRFDPNGGTWAALPSLLTPRTNAVALVRSDGSVMIIGGRSGPELGDQVTASTEVLAPNAGAWGLGPPLATPRELFGATVLLNDRALVVGGIRGVSGAPIELADAEIYAPASDAWTTLAAPYARRSPSVTALPDGRALVIGGRALETALTTSEILDPTAGTWTPTAATTTPRADHAAILLANGWVLAAGGVGAESSVALLNPAAPIPTWMPSEPLAQGRILAGIAPLGGDTILLAGGRTSFQGLALASAVVFTVRATSAPCDSAGECASGWCVDGVCCAEACDTACHACSAARGSPADGICGNATPGLVDPRGQCSSASAGACGATGACTEQGTCAKRATGTSCEGCPNQALGFCDGNGLCDCLSAHCRPDNQVLTETGTLINCGLYRCEAAVCLDTCHSSRDCVDAAGCDRDHQCVVRPSQAVISDCACRLSPVEDSSRGFALSLVALSLCVLRRVTRRSRAPDIS